MNSFHLVPLSSYAYFFLQFLVFQNDFFQNNQISLAHYSHSKIKSREQTCGKVYERSHGSFPVGNFATFLHKNHNIYHKQRTTNDNHIINNKPKIFIIFSLSIINNNNNDENNNNNGFFYN